MEKPKYDYWNRFKWVLFAGFLFVLFLLAKGAKTLAKGGSSAFLMIVLIVFALAIFAIVALYGERRIYKRNEILGNLSELLANKGIHFELKRFQFHSTDSVSGKYKNSSFIVGISGVSSAILRNESASSGIQSGFHSLFQYGIGAKGTLLFECWVYTQTQLKTEIAGSIGWARLFTGYQNLSGFDVRSEDIGASREFIKRNEAALKGLVDYDSILFVNNNGLSLFTRRELSAEDLFRKLELMFEISRKEGSR
ncbi:MAG: hypothetical protein V1909_04840 [Candidatus Micrarchaeota archaeon]